MRIQLAENFYVDEFATDNGEFNMDIHFILLLQAFRSWLGKPVIVQSGCRKSVLGDSAHNIYYVEYKRGNLITIPATASDISVDGFDSWELMDKVEEFCNAMNDGLVIWESITDDILIEIAYPIITGRGVYPDSNSGFIHLDCGHRSLNPLIRDKRKEVVRWVRLDGVYRYARDGESFADMRGRLVA